MEVELSCGDITRVLRADKVNVARLGVIFKVSILLL